MVDGFDNEKQFRHNGTATDITVGIGGGAATID